MKHSVVDSEIDKGEEPDSSTPEPGDESWIGLVQMLEEEFERIEGYCLWPRDLPEDQRRERILKRIHQSERAALCLSGGGIRSATFGLGVLQGLARFILLDEFKFLSTVSGGGFIGSWLTGWIHRHKNGARGVLNDLRGQKEDGNSSVEPQPLVHLRQYANYLTPKLGVMSVDTWTLVKTYLRNLCISWLAFIPLLMCALLVPRLYQVLARIQPTPNVPLSPTSNLVLIAFQIAVPLCGVVGAIFGLEYLEANQPRASRKKGGSPLSRKENTQQRFGWQCVLPLSCSAILVTLGWSWWSHVLLSMRPWLLIPGSMAAVHFVAALPTAIRTQSSWLARFKQIFLSTLAGAAGGCFVAAIATQLFPEPTLRQEYFTVLGPSLLLLSYPLIITVLVGLTSRFSDDDSREWWARTGGWLLILVVAWTLISYLVIFGPRRLQWFWGHMPVWFTLIGGVSGAIALLGGRSAKTQATPGSPAPTDWTAKAVRILLPLAAPIFLVVLLALIVAGTNAVLDYEVEFVHNMGAQDFTSGRAAYVLFAVCAIVAVFVSWLVNLNSFTLHASYKLRLMRAYLGASNTGRDPIPFTGFDPNDNLFMHHLWPSADCPNECRIDKPMHVVNVALNLVTGKNLAWQERKAQTFSISPLHCGNHELGYRPSAFYGGNTVGRYVPWKNGKRGAEVEARQPISLATAVTISGAAVSPNMGYHSSPAITFLLTLFNLRLGAWLGNTAKPWGNKTFEYAHPRLALEPLLREAFGQTDNESPFVYLSDGGHFENLGLYEMVLRRCRFIVVSDAGCDPKCAFTDLGNAIRKIRIDLGIPIRLTHQMQIRARNSESTMPPKYCALGVIEYSAVDPPIDKKSVPDGLLLYVKPGYQGTEPVDILNYGKACEDFPHESTSDQWFSETQFESYRALGEHVITSICSQPKRQCGLPGLFEAARSYLWRMEDPQPLSIDSTMGREGPLKGNTRVVILGKGFSAGAVVNFGDVPVTEWKIESSERMTVTSPPGITLGPVDIVIRNPNLDEVRMKEGFVYMETQEDESSRARSSADSGWESTR